MSVFIPLRPVVLLYLLQEIYMDWGMKDMVIELGHKGSEGIYQFKWSD